MANLACEPDRRNSPASEVGTQRQCVRATPSLHLRSSYPGVTFSSVRFRGLSEFLRAQVPPVRPASPERSTAVLCEVPLRLGIARRRAGDSLVRFLCNHGDRLCRALGRGDAPESSGGSLARCRQWRGPADGHFDASRWYVYPPAFLGERPPCTHQQQSSFRARVIAYRHTPSKAT